MIHLMKEEYTLWIIQSNNMYSYLPTVHQKNTSIWDCSGTTWFNGVVAFW